MLLSALQYIADLHEEHGPLLLYDAVFPLFRSEVRVQVLEFLRRDEEDVGVDGLMQVRILVVHERLRRDQSVDDALHRLLEELLVALVLGDDTFPVPLVDVDGVERVALVVPADGRHVRVHALARVEPVAAESGTFPLRQRLDHLGRPVDVQHIEFDFALDAVQVVVDAAGRGDEQRAGDAAKVQRMPNVLLKRVAREFNSRLGLLRRQFGDITFGEDQSFIHVLIHIPVPSWPPRPSGNRRCWHQPCSCLRGRIPWMRSHKRRKYLS